ncbi:MFS cation transporter [[Acholeplasma] multilocale]|uniref:MFS cation transporter n=1 Tax=[Acholeplasma] multilocale TaxID=264638 RepID=UPI000478AC11|nr:MFS cation transporter [[Acholeplasma] multilocale]
MVNNWDLFILDPLIILLGLIGIGYIWKKENASKKWLIFYVETILIWFVNGFLIKKGAEHIQISESYSTPGAIALALFGASAFFAILLKPLATYLTGRIRSRRVWMWSAQGTSAIALLMSLFIGYNTSGSAALIVFSAIFIGFSLASQSLYFLLVNEQHYYKIFPMTSSFKMAFVITLGTFIGTWIFNTNFVAQKGYEQGTNISYVGVFIVTLIALLISVVLSFKNIEKPSYIQSFSINTKEKLMPYNKKVLINLLILMVGLGIIFSLLNSSVYELFIAAKLKSHNMSLGAIYGFLRRYSDLFYIAQFILGYPIYRYLTRKIGYRQTITGVLIIMLIVVVSTTFVYNENLLLFARFIFGIAFSQIFYIWFGMAIAWNYRSSGIPITGLAASAYLIGDFLPTLITSICRLSGAGFFGTAASVSDIVNNDFDITEFITKLENAMAIIGCIVFAAIAGYLTYHIFASKIVLVEYTNLEDIEAKLISLEKKNIQNKIKSRITLD